MYASFIHCLKLVYRSKLTRPSRRRPKHIVAKPSMKAVTDDCHDEEEQLSKLVSLTEWMKRNNVKIYEAQSLERTITLVKKTIMVIMTNRRWCEIRCIIKTALVSLGLFSFSHLYFYLSLIPRPIYVLQVENSCWVDQSALKVEHRLNWILKISNRDPNLTPTHFFLYDQ